MQRLQTAISKVRKLAICIEPKPQKRIRAHWDQWDINDIHYLKSLEHKRVDFTEKKSP